MKRTGEQNMKALKPCLIFALLLALIGCSTATKAPDVSTRVMDSLKQAGLNDVSVDQDRDKGVVTLGGHVPTEADKSQAESIAKSAAGNQVVANQIAVAPPGVEADAKAINSDLDKAIEKNLEAVLIANKFNKTVKYDVKNRVITLTGEVDSEAKRSQVEHLASSVPNVQQVVNEIEAKPDVVQPLHPACVGIEGVRLVVAEQGIPAFRIAQG